MTKSDLNTAYALETPEDSVRLYRDWAETYDESFAQARGYLAPIRVAQLFKQYGGSGLVLDVGVGTGLVGEHLHALDHHEMHGTDISQEMLDVTAGKALYQSLIQADVTQTLPIKDATYNGIISAGTFTLGHIGPDVLNELIRVAKPGALFALSINAEHFYAAGFGAKFKELAPQIEDLCFEPINLYSVANSDGHTNDRGKVALFHKV